MGWIRTANYRTDTEDAATVLRSVTGPPTRYCIRRRGTDRLELTMQADPEVETPVLFVARMDVLERHLVAAFGEDIRDDLGLPELQLPWGRGDLAAGYELGDVVRGYRTLTRVGGEPVAAAPDPDLSLLTLVPLSHLMGHDVAALKRAFLDAQGRPLLRSNRYA